MIPVVKDEGSNGIKVKRLAYLGWIRNNVRKIVYSVSPKKSMLDYITMEVTGDLSPWFIYTNVRVFGCKSEIFLVEKSS